MNLLTDKQKQKAIELAEKLGLNVSFRPLVSQTVISEFARIIDAQDEKGIKKYGTTIDEARDSEYDWKLMALEETADLQKYLVKRIKELEKENRNLRDQVFELKKKTSLKVYAKNLELIKENAMLKK